MSYLNFSKLEFFLIHTIEIVVLAIQHSKGFHEK